MSRQALARLLLCLCSEVAVSKVAVGSLRLSSTDTEQYISKFSFNGPGKINGTFHSVGHEYFDGMPHMMELLILSDLEWSQYHDMLTKGSLCMERNRIAPIRVPIKPKSNSEKNRHDFTFDTDVPQPSKRTHYWFTMITDCYLEEYNAHPPNVHYEISFLNNGGHLPADELGLTTVYTFCLALMLAYGCFYLWMLQKQWKQMGQSHLIVLLLGLAAAFQTGSILCEWMHLRQYARDGKGLRWRHTWLPADFFAELLQGMSELVISLVLIGLAFGWTLGIGGAAESVVKLMASLLRKPQHLLTHMTKEGAVLLGVCVTQVTLELLGRRYEDDFNQFHDHEHWPGLLLMAMRVLLCGLFNSALRNSLTSAQGSGVEKGHVADFLRELRIFGSLWFLSFPLVVASSQLLSPHRRHAVVSGGAIIMQGTALVFMSVLFLNRGEYYKISSLGRMDTVLSGSGLSSSKVAVD